MKKYLEYLKNNTEKKKEFESAVNAAVNSIADRHGFDSTSFSEKDYANSGPTMLGAWTVVILYTAACCGQN